jgi:hypothetical protein
MQLNLRLMGMEGPRYLATIIAGTAIIKAGGVHGPRQDPRRAGSKERVSHLSSETRFSTKPSGVLIGMWWAARRRFFIRRARAPKIAAGRQEHAATTTPPSRFYKDRASEVRAQAGRVCDAGFVPEWANRKCRQRLLFSQHLRQPTTETPSTSVVLQSRPKEPGGD